MLLTDFERQRNLQIDQKLYLGQAAQLPIDILLRMSLYQMWQGSSLWQVRSFSMGK